MPPFLHVAGYRVVAPDQVGFCASSKPAHYQYSFQQLATNTRALLQQLGISRVTVIGHSTGGMLAARYALMFPREVEQLVLVNPIGLEDWKALGVPSRTIDQWYERELAVSAEGIRRYEGDADTTAVGGDIAPPEIKARLGHYEVLGPEIAARIPHARLLSFPGMGHAPQMEAPEQFNSRLIEALGNR